MSSAFLSALLLFLSFLPFKGHFLLSYVAFVPFLFSFERRRLRDFWLFGFLFFLFSLYWIPKTVDSYGNTGVVIALFAYLFLCTFLSLYFLLWGVMSRAVRYSLWGAAFFFVIAEYLRVKLFYGFPFLCLSHTHAGISWFIQIASYTGQWGVTLLIFMVNLLVLFALKGNWKNALLCGLLLLIGLSPSFLKKRPSPWGTLKVALVQPSLDEEKKWEPAFRDENLNAVLSMIDSACEKAELIVTPETTLPFYWGKDAGRTRFTLEKLSSCGAFVLLGVISYVKKRGQIFFINRAYLLNRGKIVDFYDKRILVPYGEFVPFRKELSFLYRFAQLPGDFERGKRGTIFSVKGKRFFVAICYEIAFPEYIARSAERADLLVNITNDMWFGRTIAPYLHLWAADLRAVELGRYLVRCANTGISAVIDEEGKIVKSLPLFRKGVLLADVKLFRNSTFYGAHPGLFIFIVAGVYAVFLAYRLKSR